MSSKDTTADGAPANVRALAEDIHREFEPWSLAVFPVLLERDGGSGKWDKKPLWKWRHNLFAGEIATGMWHKANAVGTPMGGLMACIDLDTHKGDNYDGDDWLAKHGIDRQNPGTLTHKTISGGTHLFFDLPNGFEGAVIGCRPPKGVKGVDVRCDGGYVVWADTVGGYTEVTGGDPTPMPISMAEELAALKAHAVDLLDGENLPLYEFVPDEVIRAKLYEVGSDLGNNATFRLRWAGDARGLKDDSRSGFDMAMASILANRRFTFSEIVDVLRGPFEHGVVARDGWTAPVERQVHRAAARAVAQVAKKRDDRVNEMARKMAALMGEQHET